VLTEGTEKERIYTDESKKEIAHYIY